MLLRWLKWLLNLKHYVFRTWRAWKVVIHTAIQRFRMRSSHLCIMNAARYVKITVHRPRENPARNSIYEHAQYFATSHPESISSTTTEQTTYNSLSCVYVYSISSNRLWICRILSQHCTGALHAILLFDVFSLCVLVQLSGTLHFSPVVAL
jgi:hypothetical protein